MKKRSRIWNLFTLALVTAIIFSVIPAKETKAASLSKKSTSILVGNKTSLTTSGTKIKSVTTSNKKVATVTKNTSKKLTITGKAKGSATITVKCTNGKKYTCKVTVYVGLTAKTKTLYAGKSSTIQLRGTTIKSVKSANKAIATVAKTSSSKLKITGKSEGKVKITVTGKDKKQYTCTVTVNPYLTKTSTLLVCGTSETVELKGATIKTISSSSTAVASVKKASSTKATITAKKPGTASISITTKLGKTLKCKVLVSKLNYTKAMLTATKTLQLKLTNDAVKSYTSANKSIATVSSTGLIKAVGKGTTKITVVSKGGKTYYCTVTVEKPVLNKTSGALLTGTGYQLTLTGTSKPVTWSSSNSNIVQVDREGRIAANNTGTCTIKATADGVSYNCKVNVTSMEFSSYGITLRPEETMTMSVRQQGPALSYTWESLNTNIATVNQKGEITGVFGVGGAATIRIKFQTMKGIQYKNTIVNVPAATDLYTYSKTENNTYSTTENKDVNKMLSSGMNKDVMLVEDNIGTCRNNRFKHNNAVAYYHDTQNNYNYYLVADTWNNRVLIYRCGETEKWDASTPIFSILGQTNDTSSVAGYTLDKLNWPVGVTVGEDNTGNIHIYVTDTQNNRILVWDGIPVTNGVSANYSINYMVDPTTYHFDDNYTTDEGFANQMQSKVSWPWAIWTDGEKMICTVTASGYVAIWDQLPDSADKYPDKILYTSGTPRTITTDGEGYLILGDHNIRTQAYEMAGARIFNDYEALFAGGISYVANPGDSFYFKDGTQPGGYILKKNLSIEGGKVLPKGTLLLAHNGYVGVWLDGKIDSQSDVPDYYIGGGNIDDIAGYYFEGGDYNQLLQDDNGNLYMTLYNGCKVVGYASGTFPAEPADITSQEIWDTGGGDTCRKNGVYYWYKRPEGSIQKHSMTAPNICIGASGINATVEEDQGHYQNCVMDSDGSYLVAMSDLHNKLLLWKHIPDENGAKPDTVYKFGTEDPMTDATIIILNGKRGLMVGGTRSLMIWNDIEDAIAGKVPNRYYRNQLGTAYLGIMSNFEYDGTYLYVSCEKGVYLFDGLPEKNQSPAGILVNMYGQIHVTECIDGKTYLAMGNVASTEGSDEVNREKYGDNYSNKCYIYDREDILTGNKENGVIKAQVIDTVNGATGNENRFNLPSDAMVTEDGQLIICDGGFQRVLIWNSINAAVNKENVLYTIGLGSNAYTSADTGSIGDDYIAVESENTFRSIKHIDYDGQYLWIGGYKFAGGIKRFSGLI